MEAHPFGRSRPRFLVEVIPPGVLPQEAFYKEAHGFRFRYRLVEQAGSHEEALGRLLGALDSLPGRLSPGIPLGVDLPRFPADSRSMGTEQWIEIGGGRSRELLLRAEFRCNQACPFCFVRLGPRRLDPQDLADVLGPVLRPGTDRVVLTGGEPTLHPRFLDLLRVLRTLGVEEIGLQTNGLLLTDPETVREMVDLGVRWVLFSLHSHRPEIYDRITRSRGQLPRAIQSLRNLAAEAPPLTITVNVVINRLNLRDLSDTLRFVAEILGPSGPGSTFFLTMMNEVGHRKAPDLAVSLEEMGEALDQALEVCRSLSGTVEPFLGDCAPPLCILRDPTPVLPKPDQVAGMVPRTDIDYLSPGAEVPQAPGRRVKSLVCRNCPHDRHCHGIPPSLAARFGIAALRPPVRIGDGSTTP